MDGTQAPARADRDAAVAARMAEINGRPQRIEPIPQAEVTGEARELVMRINGSIGGSAPKKVAEYFRVMAHHPALLRCQLEMGTALFTGRLPARERELAILRIAWLLGAPYEWGEHVELAKRFGVAAEEIERATLGSTAAGWAPHDRAILAAVEEMLANQTVADAVWTVLALSWDEPQLIEFAMVVGQYVATALVQNALRLRLGHHNPGLTHR